MEMWQLRHLKEIDGPTRISFHEKCGIRGTHGRCRIFSDSEVVGPPGFEPGTKGL